MNWVHHVLKSESFFLYYPKMQRRTFFQSTTSPHEGTNFGIKAHAASVKPCHSVSQAGHALLLQGTLKMGWFLEDAIRGIIRKSLWSNSDTSNYLLPTGKSILQQSLKRMDQYQTRRTGEKMWNVLFKEQSQPIMLQGLVLDGEEFLPIPRFASVRTVSLDTAGYLFCSWCHFEGTGLPCVHQATVIRSLFPSWKSFTHHDVALCWWKLWYAFAYEKEHAQLSLLLEHLHSQEVPGPSLPGPLPAAPQSQYDEPFPLASKPAAERVINYPVDQVQEIMRLGGISAPTKNWTCVSAYEGLTQESFNCNSKNNNNQEEGEDDNSPFEQEGGPFAAVNFADNIRAGRCIIRRK